MHNQRFLLYVFLASVLLLAIRHSLAAQVTYDGDTHTITLHGDMTLRNLARSRELNGDTAPSGRVINTTAARGPATGIPAGDGNPRTLNFPHLPAAVEPYSIRVGAREVLTPPHIAQAYEYGGKGDLRKGKVYTYRICTVDENGLTSLPGNEVSVAPRGTKPGIVLNWVPGSGKAARYRIFRTITDQLTGANDYPIVGMLPYCDVAGDTTTFTDSTDDGSVFSLPGALPDMDREEVECAVNLTTGSIVFRDPPQEKVELRYTPVFCYKDSEAFCSASIDVRVGTLFIGGDEGSAPQERLLMNSPYPTACSLRLFSKSRLCMKNSELRKHRAPYYVRNNGGAEFDLLNSTISGSGGRPASWEFSPALFVQHGKHRMENVVIEDNPKGAGLLLWATGFQDAIFRKLTVRNCGIGISCEQAQATIEDSVIENCRTSMNTTWDNARLTLIRCRFDESTMKQNGKSQIIVKGDRQ